jgi:uncharacterized protein YqkB
MTFNLRTSQSFQDVFAYQIVGNNGTYIEIGAREPISMSNTYNLETEGGWTGFSLEIDKSFEPLWNNQNQRKNAIFWEDALTFNYSKKAKKLSLSQHVSYLSCDIEPPANTFNALQLVVSQGFTFDVITFEHDRYSFGNGIEDAANEFLIAHGYKPAVVDVYTYRKNKKIYYETWYVKNHIEFEKISFEEWLVQYNLNL